MLACLSDLHLSDRSSNDSLVEKLLVEVLESLLQKARKVDCNHIDILWLGDILDLLVSPQWSRTSLRPWDTPTAELGTLIHGIVVATRERYPKFFDTILALRQNGEREGIPIWFHYVIGNHDALLNSEVAEDARKVIHKEFCLFGRREGSHLVPYKCFKEYGVYAVHGHEFDPSNSAEENLWPLGDAVVIELLQGFLSEVKSELPRKSDKRLIDRLDDLFYVRPDMGVPLYIYSVLQEDRITQHQKKIVQEAWEHAVDRFMRIQYFQERIDDYDERVDMKRLRRGLKASKPLRRVKDLLSLLNWGRKRLLHLEDPIHYEHHALDQLNNFPSLKYFVMGHTHKPGLLPLVPHDADKSSKTYLNTGTWRKIHVPLTFERSTWKEFSAETVLSYAIFYNTQEQLSTEVACELQMRVAV